jgi:3-methylfumaryl-CoA hydratase
MAEWAEPTIDLAVLRGWIGRRQDDADGLTVRQARLMAATLDRGGALLAAGDALPPLWHWIYFLSALPPAQLGRDGHPARGGFLPPVGLSNRMWAGGQLDFERPLVLGETVQKRTTVEAIEGKSGRSGPLIFVTLRHELFGADGMRAIVERQDIVFRDPPAGGPSGPPVSAPGAHETERAWAPDALQLFRYSALSFNGHRIHYDADYCREVEGYASPVVHGPLQATMLACWAQELLGRPLQRFHYRGLRPAVTGDGLRLRARRDPACGDGSLQLWTAFARDDSISLLAQAQ